MTRFCILQILTQFLVKNCLFRLKRQISDYFWKVFAQVTPIYHDLNRFLKCLCLVLLYSGTNKRAYFAVKYGPLSFCSTLSNSHKYIQYEIVYSYEYLYLHHSQLPIIGSCIIEASYSSYERPYNSIRNYLLRVEVV